MSWRNEIPLIVRYLIDDINSSKYSDERIETSILISAQLILMETRFDNEYTINIVNNQLSPDPTSPRDDSFITLTALKTACIIVGSEIKTESANSISIKDGPSSIDLRGVSSTLVVLYKDLCEKYDKLLRDYKENKVVTAGQAILGPYSPASDYVTRTHGDYDHRGGYFRY